MNVWELVEGVVYESDNCKYIVDRGKLLFRISSEMWESATNSYNDVVDMEFVECNFEPKEGEDFFYPDLFRNEGYKCGMWFGYDTHNNVKKRVGVYRTKEQAVEKAKELGWLG